MKRQLVRGVLLIMAAQSPCLGAEAAAPQAGNDYYAWQIASGDSQALLKLFHQYRALPYVRIERRGNLHVLRAGMWASAAMAREAVVKVAPAHALVRVATYRPDAILHQNWEDLPAAPAVQAVTPGVAPSDAGNHATHTTPVRRRVPPVAPASSVPQFSLLPAPSTAVRAFNQEDFALAFQVFLGSGDRQRAYQVASQAVASVPGNTDWRRKLARLADWTNQPLVAWEHWNYLFQRGDRSAETSDAVLRLAPLAGQPDIAIAVWKKRADRAPLTAPQWRDLLELFEAADQVPAGSQYFETQYRRNADPQLLEYAARLANNVGDDARALVLYRERATVQPFSLDAVTRAVMLLIRADRLREAFDLMQAHRHAVPAEMDDFWRTLASTAWDLQETAAAEAAYRTYTKSPQATVADWSRLVYLARQHAPESAAELVLQAYRRWGRLDDLLLALGIYAQNANFAGQARVFKSLTDADLQTLQQQPQFLILRAQYAQNQGDGAAAWIDYHRALALAPADSQVTVPSLWFLIGQGRRQELAPLLRKLTPLGRMDARYWLAFAAAHQVLDQHRDAVYWYHKAVRAQPDDGLLLLNYADALGAVRRTGMADRVRRHAWLRLRDPSVQRGRSVPLDKQPELLAWARLQLLNQPGDPSLQTVRSTVEQLRGLDIAALRERRQVQDLVLGWAVFTSQFPNARNWMWLQQARKNELLQAAPVWAQSQLALQLGNRQEMQHLLDDQVSRMPIYNRYDTAYAMGHEAQALGIAFDVMQGSRDDEEMHDRYRQHAPRAANYVQYRAANEASAEDLHSQSRQVEASLQIAPHMQLVLGWSQLGQSTGDASPGTQLPATQRLGSIGLQWQYPRGGTHVRLFERNELATQVGVILEQTWAWSRRAVFGGGLGYRADALDSVALRTAGTQDYLQMGLTYDVDKRTALRANTRWAQYSTQPGDALGEGQIHDLEARYRLRLDYPDARIRLYVSDQSFHTTASGPALVANLSAALGSRIFAAGVDPARYFLPQSSTTWGACMGFGENLAGQNIQYTYTRAVRPFMEWCETDHSRTGSGYSAAIGMAGSVLGPDHLSLGLEQNEGGLSRVDGSLTRNWTLRYRIYF